MLLRRLQQRLFAYALRPRGGRYRRCIDAHKLHWFKNAVGDMLEIGFGTGTNLPLLPPLGRYCGIDPNPYMHQQARRMAERLGRSVQLLVADASNLPFPSRSFDTVIVTLVLCSVSDPSRVLAEIGRVLRPGGAFIFLEHVAAPVGSTTRRWQERTTPVWRVVGCGCSPARETERAIRAAGFDRVEVERFCAPVPIFGPHIAGVGFARMTGSAGGQGASSNSPTTSLSSSMTK